ncbi:CRISPR-associated helicase/endonuclease Cas3 [Sinisalibacter aestuarii]|uniref:CRISPR-associated helicase/endonuclease Cas3 n=1 Tax=Sinisalibacter aestuarii TaxID=2949426 RepID=A0ABQ5LVX3_9RHOB|nr:CRISPR-associated helicase/endonuclease Cas3 [Sinisalibacter aestuarii]
MTEVFLREADHEFECLGLDGQRRKWLYGAVAGHHGRPPEKSGDAFLRMKRAAGPEAFSDAVEVIRAFRKLWPNGSLAEMSRDEVRALSWWLPGFITAADWIGSNAEWFPAEAPGLALADYLDAVRNRAARAVQETGLVPARVTETSLFRHTPRPMQAHAADVPLPDGPVLAIMEDGTGSGKTEAALVLAQRMLQAGKGRGLFFALPTMATADAMFARLRPDLGRLFATPPSLTLAHGRAGISREWRDLALTAMRHEDEPGPTAWLSDNRRKALLANVGIGTIDQALLAVLKAKHAPLRLYGLSSKILIVDEVHEVGDPYMAELLATLLRSHRQNGGSAILLTATLPVAQRDMLLRAWGAEPPALAPYPALTLAGAAPETVAPMPDLRGAITVERLEDDEAVVSLLQGAAAQGAACVWVRNAVDDAMAAVRALRDRGVEADLLHARFALADRLAHQGGILERFGKERTGGAGRVLVATQVVESSLDLDFDVMVSDLAPIAALIQRAGRLWRHMDLRPAESRPVRAPVLHVLSPDPAAVDDSTWLHRVLDGGAWVYPLDQQWRTAQALFSAGMIETPHGLRLLIEAVEGPNADPVPPQLEEAEQERIGAGYGARTLAGMNRIDLDRDYRDGGGGADDRDYPTRLGVEQKVLVLARWENGRVVPWADEADRTEDELWVLSEVSVAARRAEKLALPDQDVPEILAVTKGWPEWRREAVTLCPVGADGRICEGLHYRAAEGLVFAERSAETG